MRGPLDRLKFDWNSMTPNESDISFGLSYSRAEVEATLNPSVPYLGDVQEYRGPLIDPQ